VRQSLTPEQINSVLLACDSVINGLIETLGRYDSNVSILFHYLSSLTRKIDRIEVRLREINRRIDSSPAENCLHRFYNKYQTDRELSQLNATLTRLRAKKQDKENRFCLDQAPQKRQILRRKIFFFLEAREEFQQAVGAPSLNQHGSTSLIGHGS
jgi:hypothetical protein